MGEPNNSITARLPRLSSLINRGARRDHFHEAIADVHPDHVLLAVNYAASNIAKPVFARQRGDIQLGQASRPASGSICRHSNIPAAAATVQPRPESRKPREMLQ